MDRDHRKQKSTWGMVSRPEPRWIFYFMPMNIKLDRTDLINLIKGSCPSYDIMDDPIIKKLGRYVGGFVDAWQWEYSFPEEITDEQLLETYFKIKQWV